MKHFMDFEELLYTKVKDVKDPIRAHDTDAGIDFFIPNDFKEITLKPGEDINIESGIKTVVPRGYALIFKEKSGVALNKKLICGAAVIDSDYRGELHLHLFNNGTKDVTLCAGDKITQGLLVPVLLLKPKEISMEVFDEYCNTERGEGGFGSTGTK